MGKILLQVLVFLSFFLVSGYTETIKKIEISGNKRISNQTILVLGDISLNEDFNNSKLNNSLKKLFDSNFFNDIKMNLDNGILKIVLVENPIIENIEFTGIKNKTFIKEISETIVLKNRMSFTETQLQNDVNLIKIF